MIGIRASLEGLEVREVMEVYVWHKDIPDYQQRMEEIGFAAVAWFYCDAEFELAPKN